VVGEEKERESGSPILFLKRGRKKKGGSTFDYEKLPTNRKGREKASFATTPLVPRGGKGKIAVT